MKKRMSIVAASMVVVLGLAGCQNKETGQATTSAVATTTAEIKTTEAGGTEATKGTTVSTSEKVNETEEKDLLPISEKHFPDAAFRAYIEEEVDTNRAFMRK